MAGEIMTAFISVLPSMKGFGAEAARQIGPQATAVGARAGRQAGAAFSAEASKGSQSWLASTAQGAIKNVTLYGSMYAIITKTGQGISAMLDAMIGFNGQLEQSTIGFETLLGSSAAAGEQMQWIKDFAKETPFKYGDLVGYSQQLLALGFNAEMSKEVLEATGDAAAALGRGSESIQRINLALGQMWTKGKVQSQEMLQLTEAGIGAWQILADAYGTSVEQIQEAVTDGIVKASDAVPALLDGMNARFGGLMEKQSQTYQGMLSNIQDTLQQQLAEAGEPLFQVLTVEAKKFLDALDDPEVVKMMTQLGQALADGAEFLAKASMLAWKYRDAILAVAIAVTASSLLSKVPSGSMLSAGTWFNAARAQEAYAAGLSRTAAIQAGISSRGMAALGGVGQIAGLAATTDGLRRVYEAARDGESATAGLAESVAGATVAGAAFGSVIPGLGTAAGAALGAIAGLTTGIWAYQKAIDAANNDTSLAQSALESIGADASIATLALGGVTNANLEAVGGIEALRNAMKAGTTDEFLAAQTDQAVKLHARYEELQSLRNEYLAKAGDYAAGGVTEAETAKYERWSAEQENLFATMGDLDAAIAALGSNFDALAAATDQITTSGYGAAYAADVQTGALGAMTQAAWEAVMAQGGLGTEALYAAARMEGLAGMAGYATQMISGIPTGTAINFTTNAGEVTQKIIALKAMSGAAMYGGASYDARLAELQAQLQGSLTSAAPTLSLPASGGSKKSGGGGSAASKAADAAAKAAADAARQLEQDRKAQVAFGDAFGTLMESALEGNFEEYRKKLEDEITSLTRDGYGMAADTLKRMSGALTTAALDYAALTAKLNVASDAFDELTAKMQDQYDTSRDLILGLGKATDAQSFDQLAYLLGETTSKALEYQTVLAQLKNQGLSDDLWNQLAQAGPESMGLAQSILDQGQSGIDQLNGLSDSLVNAAESMGTLTSEQMYQNGVNDMQRYIEGLKSQSSALEAQMETIANTVLNATAGAITPGNAGYSQVSAAPQQVVYQFGDITFDASKMSDLNYIQDFIAMLNQAATTQLVNQAGTVTS